jgi:DNA replication protein DnaC
MGSKLVFPGVYEFDPESGESDDFERHERLKRFSNLPPDYANARFSTFELIEGRQEGFDAACRFVKNEIDPPILLMYGEPGRSKTHLAASIIHVFIAKLVPSIFYHTGDLLDDMREGIRIQRLMSPLEASQQVRSASFIINRCKNIGLLVLDDLGLGDETEWAWGKLDTIVNHRYDFHLPTVITANTLEVSDRIRDRCRQGMVVRLKGESYREIIAERKEAGAKKKKEV